MTVFVLDGDGNIKGYASYETTHLKKKEETIEVTESELAGIFETAKSNGETLDGADSSIEAAIDDPLAFLDYLILDSNGAITFDSDYARPKPDETQA